MGTAVTMPGVVELSVVLVCLAVGALLTVLPFWKICSKAGFSDFSILVMEEG